jgi:hypothetical protein
VQQTITTNSSSAMIDSMSGMVAELQEGVSKSSAVSIYFVNPSYSSEEHGDYQVAKLNINDNAVNAMKQSIASCLENIKDRYKISITDLEIQDEDYILTVPCSEVDNLNEYLSIIESERYLSFHVKLMIGCFIFLNDIQKIN